jgi:putative ABC transport system permease protein
MSLPMRTVFQDLRYGFRVLRKNPGFTIVAMIALALGIASTTAIFSVVNEVLLSPLPYPNSGRIVALGNTQRSTGAHWSNASPANYLDWVARNHVFSLMAASRGFQGNLTGGERPERVPFAIVSGNFFQLFEVNPLLGRSLLPEDEKAGNDHVVVLGYGLWKSRFGSDRSLVGRTITLNGEPYTVVGVMPANFAPDDYGQLWIPSPWDVPPYPLTPGKDPRGLRDSNYFEAWGRLKPGATMAQARAEMDGIARQLEKEYPDADTDLGISLVPMQDNLVRDIRPALILLVAAVALVLLIGCVNVANLLLARATDRAKEISVRSALGASRWRLIRQMLTESILLALLGGGLGVLLAAWAVPALLALSPPDISDFKHIGLHPEVLAFSIAVSVLSGILFGVLPALQSSGINLSGSLKESERGSTSGRGKTRSTLVVTEVALSLVLLVGAGLVVKSFVRLMNVDPGFDPDRLLVFNIGLPPSATPAQQDAFYQQVQERVTAVPGVESAGAVSRLPLTGGNSDRSFKIPGSDQEFDADIRVSTPNYFHAMGIPLLKGRSFTDQDSHASTAVAVVNETFARTVYPGQDPIGKYILDFGPTKDRLQIIGVVGSVRHQGLDAEPQPELHLRFGQAHWPSVFMIVRCKTSDPLTLTSAVQDAVWSVNRDVPLSNLRTMQGVIANSVVRRKFTTLLLAIFAGLAMLLAAIGLYGVMAYMVSQRTHEIGIRMALGAQKMDVLKLVVGHGLWLVGLGIVCGVVISVATTRLMSDLLFGVSTTDPTVFAVVVVLLASIAVAANYLPARRATKVDPMVALRYE